MLRPLQGPQGASGQGMVTKGVNKTAELQRAKVPRMFPTENTHFACGTVAQVSQQRTLV